MGEAKDCQARRRVGLVAQGVASLLGGRPVVTQAVCLDDEVEVGPVEIDAEAVDTGLGQGKGQTGAAGDWQEAALELGIGVGEGQAIQKAANGGHSRLAVIARERGAKPFGVDQG